MFLRYLLDFGNNDLKMSSKKIFNDNLKRYYFFPTTLFATQAAYCYVRKGVFSNESSFSLLFCRGWYVLCLLFSTDGRCMPVDSRPQTLAPCLCIFLRIDYVNSWLWCKLVVRAFSQKRDDYLSNNCVSFTAENLAYNNNSGNEAKKLRFFIFEDTKGLP